MNDSQSTIQQVEEKKKQYTARDVKRADRARRFKHTTDQTAKWILRAVEKNIIQNFPIPREDIRISEDIYGTSVTHLKRKTVRHNIHHVEPIIVPNFPKYILDRWLIPSQDVYFSTRAISLWHHKMGTPIS